MAKFGTNASGAIWWPNLERMQVVHLVAKFGTNAAMWSLNLVQDTESISGSVVPLAMFNWMSFIWPTSLREYFVSFSLIGKATYLAVYKTTNKKLRNMTKTEGENYFQRQQCNNKGRRQSRCLSQQEFYQMRLNHLWHQNASILHIFCTHFYMR